jgi:protein arginine N-methyltransferase 1
MADEVRMEAYDEAIRQIVRPGDVVVDLGAGLGVLGFLALRAGAARVYAIEKGDALDLARVVARENGLEDRCVFLQENSKDVELPEPADLLLSETLGSFAADENTLDFTIDARTRLLKPGARMIPRRLRLWTAPIEAPAERARAVFWEDVRGLDYSAAAREVLGRMSLSDVNREQLLGDPLLYHDVDLETVTSPSLEQKLEFELRRKGRLDGLAGWFQAELADDVSIDTAPGSPPTHWRQAFFPFREPIEVDPGDRLRLVLRIGPKEDRSDDTTVSYEYLCFTPPPDSRPAPRGKVGRNDPCPCGSGRKSKRCCAR